MRLIDADKIVYSWQIDADGNEHDGVTLQSIIRKMPTIIPERPTEPQIIRCKDCIHYKPMSNDSEWGYCSVHGNRTCQSIDFCAWAERKTDEEVQDNS